VAVQRAEVDEGIETRPGDGGAGCTRFFVPVIVIAGRCLQGPQQVAGIDLRAHRAADIIQVELPAVNPARIAP